MKGTIPSFRIDGLHCGGKKKTQPLFVHEKKTDLFSADNNKGEL